MKKAKTRTAATKDAQTAFNAYIRLRDAKDPCISCGRVRDIYHAGHYRATGSHPELRFNEDNCHKQCAHCNLYLSGNLIEYRLSLIKKLGAERVDALESYNPPKKYTVDELIDLRRVYKDKANDYHRITNTNPIEQCGNDTGV